MTQKLNVLVKRLNRLGITIELVGNYPWVYLTKINQNVVRDKYLSEHGFVIAYMTSDFTDTSKLFETIRKYIDYENKKT